MSVIEQIGKAIGKIDANSGPGNTYTSNPVPVTDVLAAHVIDDIAKAVLQCLSDNIDEGGLEAAFKGMIEYIMSNKDDHLPKLQAAEIALRDAITTYLNTICKELK